MLTFGFALGSGVVGFLVGLFVGSHNHKSVQQVVSTATDVANDVKKV